MVYSYFQSLEVVSRQIGGVKVDLSHISQNSSTKPFESVDKETQKRAIQIYHQAGFKKSGENPKSVLIGNKYYSGYYFYKDLIKND